MIYDIPISDYIPMIVCCKAFTTSFLGHVGHHVAAPGPDPLKDAEEVLSELLQQQVHKKRQQWPSETLGFNHETWGFDGIYS